MPQTKFVTGKALALGLKPIVVVNKIDRPDARASGSARRGVRPVRQPRRQRRAARFPGALRQRPQRLCQRRAWTPREGTLTPLFETIVEPRPAPLGRPRRAVQIPRHPARPRQFPRPHPDRPGLVGHRSRSTAPIHALDPDGKVVETGRASKLMAFRGLERVPVDEASAGDIISIAGLTTATVANTIADPSVTEPLHAQPIDPPTLSMRFAVNDSPDGRPRRHQGHQPDDPRPPAPRSREQRRDHASPKAPTRTASKSPAAASSSSAC